MNFKKEKKRLYIKFLCTICSRIAKLHLTTVSPRKWSYIFQTYSNVIRLFMFVFWNPIHTNASQRIHASFYESHVADFPFRFPLLLFFSFLYSTAAFISGSCVRLSFRNTLQRRKASPQSINFLFVWLLKILLLCHTPSTL